MTIRRSRSAQGSAWLALACMTPCADATDLASYAEVTLRNGPHSGTYRVQDKEGCMLAPAAKGGPVLFNAVMSAANALLSVEIPSVDPQHLSELMVTLTVSDASATGSRRGTATAEYAIDTRPAAALAVYEREERAKLGARGRGVATLVDQGKSARLTFTGETKQGVRIDGTIQCAVVDREFGR